MHYHIDWSSTGFGPESFGSFAEASYAAHLVVEANRLTPSPLNETYKIEPFEPVCPICMGLNSEGVSAQ
jgi:hypothetical protein